MIPVYQPYLPPQSIRHARQALESGWVSWVGEYAEQAEAILAERLGVRHAILVSNGTAAGHLISRCIRQFHPEIRRFVVPNNVFVAAWNGLLYEYPVSALMPVDAHLESWNANLDEALGDDLGPDTCILAVHNLGNIINVPALQRRFPNTLVCEDACESVFGSYEGKPAGSMGWMSSISFFSNKNISCGEGGAVLTNDDEAAKFVRLLKGQGQGPTRYLHTELGYNYRMSNVQAGLLLGQLERWDEIYKRKRDLFEAYAQRLGGHPGVALQRCEPFTQHSNWMFGVRILGLQDHGRAVAEFQRAGVETRRMFFPIHRHGHLQSLQGEHAVAELLHRECLILPSWPALTEVQIDHVCGVVEQVCTTVAEHV